MVIFMKVLYLDLGMGAAGDMLTAALTELLPDRDSFLAELNSIGIPEVSVTAESSVKCGITGTHITVKVGGVEEDAIQHHHHEHDHGHEHTHEHTSEHELEHEHEHTLSLEHGHTHAPGHHHSSLNDVKNIIDSLSVSAKVKSDALAVYQLIAEAESHAHGKPVTEIHFHEVGAMDAIADVTAVCMLIERLAPDRIIASPVHVGSGSVSCAHGILPVPAPATAHILLGIPTYGGSVRGELCTPTGAALLKHFVTEYGPQPTMRTSAIGYGMGKKDFEAANCVRAMLGESEGSTDTIYELSCNVDDMTAERIAFAMERFLEAGAREAYTQPIGMKKNRPGTLLQVLCAEKDREKMVHEIFKYTTTIGIRERSFNRYILNRTVESLDTPWGRVRRKNCSGYGVAKAKYEYDDLARIAKEKNISLDEVVGMLEKSEIAENPPAEG